MRRETDFVVGEQKDEGGAQGETAPVQDPKRTGWLQQIKRERILRGEVYKLFVDLSSPYGGCRLSIFKYFWVLSQEKAETTTTRKSKEQDGAETTYDYVRLGLASAFLLLYNKLKTTGIRIQMESSVDSPATAVGFICWILIWTSRMALPLAAGILFELHSTQVLVNDPEAYIKDTDTQITSAILLCTAMLEICSIFPLFFTEKKFSTSRNPVFTSREQWPEMVAQYNPK